MRIRPTGFNVDMEERLAIGWHYKLGRAAKYEEVADFVDNAIELSLSEVFDEYEHRKDAR